MAVTLVTNVHFHTNSLYLGFILSLNGSPENNLEKAKELIRNNLKPYDKYKFRLMKTLR